MTTVSLVKNNQSYQGTLKLLEPLKEDLGGKISRLKEMVVKINFVSAERELATTPFNTVKAFVDFIKPLYKGKIIIAEEATIGDTKEGFKKFGFQKLADEDPQVEIFDTAEDEFEEITVKYQKRKFTFPVAKIYLQSPFIASITRAKTHDTVITTLGIKNLIVGAIKMEERSKIHQGKGIHWLMTEIGKKIFPDLTIIDAVVGMEGNGPVGGEPIKAGWLVASFDAVAADSLASYLMGFEVKDIGYLNLAAQEKLGKIYPKDKIEIIGPNPDHLVTLFKPHRHFEHQRQWR